MSIFFPGVNAKGKTQTAMETESIGWLPVFLDRKTGIRFQKEGVQFMQKQEIGYYLACFYSFTALAS